jgi:Leucine-rich repeat (LRR) protein
MIKDKSLDRLSFLAEKFNVFDDTKEGIKDISDHLAAKGYVYSALESNKNVIYAFTSYKPMTPESGLVDLHNRQIRVDISFTLFNTIVNSDPSSNNMYTQWMLTVFTRYLKDNNEAEAIRFVFEDLPLASNYLNIFEKNKRKTKFKEFCKNNFALRNVKDPLNINQYKSLSELYDAVDPFIEKDPSNIEKLINEFVEKGKAVIPYRDRKFTLYIPKVEEASWIFDEFVGWCTAKKSGTMFSHYRNDAKYLRPDGKESDIYIVIDNRFFSGELKTKYLYQIHFESQQVKDRIQGSNSDFLGDVLSKCDGINKFFYYELMGLAKARANKSTRVNDNVYIDLLVSFGWTEALFDVIEEYTPVIRFVDRKVPKLPNMSKFKNLNTLIICNSGLREIHPSIGELTSLEELLLPNNSLTELPSEIGKLKNLIFININGNKITKIPDEIKYLDKTNGGNLYRISFNRDEIGEANYNKLKELLPTTKI